MSRIFIHLNGDVPNIGDAVIRRLSLEWVRNDQPVVAYTANAPDAWVRQLHLLDGDVLLRGNTAFALWLARALFSPRRPVLVLEPGEVILSRRNFPRELVLLVVTALLRLRGGRVILPPRAVSVRPRVRHSTATVVVHRIACRLATRAFWRDEWSKELVRAGTLVPDIAFSSDSRDGLPWQARKTVGISLRGLRDHPGESWLRAIKKFAEQHRLDIATFAQVESDQERAREIASQLDGHYIEWVGDEASHERRLRAFYDSASLIISDRLHVLILGALAGAIPTEVVPKPAPKVSTHFATAEITGVSMDSAKESEDDIYTFLDGLMLQERAASNRRKIDRASARLAAERASLRKVLWSKEARR